MATFRTHSDHLDANRLLHWLAAFTWSQAKNSPRFQVLLASSAVFVILAIDAALRFPGRLDIETTKVVQRLHIAQLHTWSDYLGLLTDSSGAVIAWGVTLVIFSLLRWWLPVLGVLAIPIGGIVNETISRVLIQRTRPHLEELRHVSRNFEERSFPSGHVVGAVLLIRIHLVRRGRPNPIRAIAPADQSGLRGHHSPVWIRPGVERSALAVGCRRCVRAGTRAAVAPNLRLRMDRARGGRTSPQRRRPGALPGAWTASRDRLRSRAPRPRAARDDCHQADGAGAGASSRVTARRSHTGSITRSLTAQLCYRAT